MFRAVTLLVLVSVVGGMNVTRGGSRMAWMKSLLDHHDWLDVVDSSNVTEDLSAECLNDMRTYITALNNGKVWASKSKSNHLLNVGTYLGLTHARDTTHMTKSELYICLKTSHVADE